MEKSRKNELFLINSAFLIALYFFVFLDVFFIPSSQDVICLFVATLFYIETYVMKLGTKVFDVFTIALVVLLTFLLMWGVDNAAEKVSVWFYYVLVIRIFGTLFSLMRARKS